MGRHHCLYYDTLKDLCGVVASFLRDGIRKHMFCFWILPEGLGVEAAKAGLKESLEDLDKHIEAGQLEIREFREWYIPSGVFNQAEVLESCAQKEKQALERGFSALCVIGDGSWFLKENREELMTYESAIVNVISQSNIFALCTYSTEIFIKEERKTLSKYHDVTLSHLHGTLTISN